jgi:broad specificity phosphatase PhoE
MLKRGITIYFIRHGETDWNRDRRYQGQKDIPLNATGRDQARAQRPGAGRGDGRGGGRHRLCGEPPAAGAGDHDIVRGELGLAPEAYRLDDRLKEVHYGDWEGQLQDDLLSGDPEGCAARERDAWGWQPRGGESYAMMSRRVAWWFGEVARDTVVVAHGGVSRALRGLVLDLPKSEVPGLPVPQDKVLVVADGAVSWL